MIKKILFFLILAVFLGWAGWFVIRHREEFMIVTKVSLGHALGLLLLCLGTTICNGLYVKYLLLAYDLDLPWREWTSLSIVTSAANYIMPFRGGAGVRAVYLKARHQFGIVDFISTLAATYIIYFLVHGVLGIIGMLLLLHRGIPFNWPLGMIFLGVTAFAVMVMLTNIKLPEFKIFPLKHLAFVANRWALVSGNRLLFRRLIGNTAVYAILSLLQIKLSFSAWGIHLPWDSTIFFTAGQAFAALVTVTPGALGVAEGLTVYMGKILHYTTAQGIMVHGLWRVTTLVTIFGLTPLALHLLNMNFSSLKGRRMGQDDPVLSPTSGGALRD